MAGKGKHKEQNNVQQGDWIHRMIAHMEHLMDLFEIALAFIVPSESQSATFVPTEKRCARAGSAAERHAAERNM